MNKDIKYTGYSAVPSDYECPDGELDIAHNLSVDNDGNLSAVAEPKVIINIPGLRHALIHDVSGQRNLIFLTQTSAGDRLSLCWLPFSDNPDPDDASFIMSPSGFRDIAAIGNTLIIAADDGLSYILWKDSGYRTLGSRPPFISIDFGLALHKTLSNTLATKVNSKCSPVSILNGNAGNSTIRVPSDADCTEFTQAAYSLLLESVNKNITSQGYFYQPFFVRYAYRLFDGSYRWQSAPILMLPTVIPPVIKCENDGAVSDDGIAPAIFSLKVNAFKLVYRILSETEKLRLWADIVTAVDIFVSAPIYTYDQSKDIKHPTVTTLASLALKANGKSGSSAVGIDSVFDGRFSPRGNDNHADQFISTKASDTPIPVVNIQRHEKFISNIRDCAHFYKIFSIEIDSLKSSDDFSQVPSVDLSDLIVKTELPDDYQSHASVIPSCLYSFNSRLNMCGITIKPAEPFSLRAASQFGKADGLYATVPLIKVYTKANGVSSCSQRIASGSAPEDMFHNLAGNFPRYIFYPDPSAYKMEFFYNQYDSITIPLKPHDFLNGAYYLSESLSSIPLTTETENGDFPGSYPAPNKIYTSEVGNPFSFPLNGINTIGNGQVFAISSAAKALSQGQFGQFPLYAFTSDGVWALETTASGTYSARQPITRDVCLSARCITQLDSSVLFASSRGIMLLSGSVASCISDNIDAAHPFSISSIPDGAKILDMAGIEPSRISLLPFKEFIKDLRMIYDYADQRIIAFNPKYSYAYLYSLISKTWTTIDSSFAQSVNSYPNPLAIDHDGNIISLDQSAGNHKTGLLITRPLKLALPVTLKTLDAMIQRGFFRYGNIRSILYGSRDLFNWHLVKSSHDHYVRGYSGSPFKYFRIVLICDLPVGESVFGCTVHFNPRFTNRIR